MRAYREQAIAPQDLDRILEAARRTPSAGNQQAWDFVVCTDTKQLTPLPGWARRPPRRRLGGDDCAGGPNLRRRPHARPSSVGLGQAIMSIMLAAADLGIGSAHAGIHDQELARRLLGVPEDRFYALLITLGVPADRPLTPIQRPDRRPLEDVVHRGHW